MEKVSFIMQKIKESEDWYMNYGIFRSQPIMTVNDLAQIGSHNKREKKAYEI